MILDAVDRLMLDEAGRLEGRVLVLDDLGGAVTEHLRVQNVDTWAYCDDARDAEALPPDCRVDALSPEALAGVEVVLLRLGKSLGSLEDYCQVLTGASDSLRLVAGGRVKHMTTAQNEVLARYFGEVRASLGRQKCRVLHAARPLGTAARWPRSRVLAEVGLTVWSFGTTFKTNRLDAGTALLVRALEGHGLIALDDGSGLTRAGEGRALDLGCGSGILACLLARSGWGVEASDVSAAAVASTRLTATANRLAVDAVWRDGLRGVQDKTFDLIVSNPPFHLGTAKDSTPTIEMFTDAARALVPGGELWVVFNSHLPYLPALRRLVGPTDIVARDPGYTVTRSARKS